MRADLATLAAAADPFAVSPADLPSIKRAAETAAAPLAAAPLAAGPAHRADSLPRPEHVPFAGTRRPRRRIRPRHAVAAGVIGLVAFQAFSERSSVHLHEGHRTAVAHRAEVLAARAVERAERAAAPAWSSLNERERRVLALAQGVAADLRADDEAPVASAEVLLGRALAERAPDEPSPAAAPTDEPPVGSLPAHGRVLVLEDVTTGVDERVLALLRARLRERSFRVVGEEQDESAAAGAVELLASARHALGLGRADEAETQAALQRFLEDSADLSGLIVVSRASDDGEHVYRVFVRSSGR
jgi:hypothetical protein